MIRKPPSSTLPLIGRPESIQVDSFALSVASGPDRGKTARADGTELSIGLSEHNGFVLTDKAVSRHHCCVAATPRGFLVRDLGSKNGTRVNGCRFEQGYVEEAAVIEIGRTKLRFEPLDDVVTQPLSQSERYGKVLGGATAMRRIFALLPGLAASESTVLLQGETGTGKGLLAKAIHESSLRASQPFVVLDCASIPATLVESELFGHVKGSFTGAHADRAGAFEQAAGGTIFLDEIGELPIDMQPKLLRALEERTVKRVGGHRTVDLDVRVLAATNRDLRAEVNRGTFRSDLYYRLDVFRVELPPLRERRDDIPLLVAHFLEERRPGQKPPRQLIEALSGQSLPGNVRELRSAVERWVLLDELGAESLKDPGVPAATGGAVKTNGSFDPSVPFRVAKEQAVTAWERAYLDKLMDHAGGNLSLAARVVGTDRSHLRELLRKHDLRRE